jgi:hypothetical protein
VAEDGSETMNVFEHNFVMRSEGSGDFAPRSGYGGAANDPGGEGSGFWLRGPNNVVRNNVAANVEVFGFDVAAGALGTVRAPRAPGADTSEEGGYRALDTTVAAAAGVQRQRGVRRRPDRRGHRLERHADEHARVARDAPGDCRVPGGRADDRWGGGARRSGGARTRLREPAGIWLTNYAAKHVVIRRADVQGLRVGVFSPFSLTAETEPGRGRRYRGRREQLLPCLRGRRDRTGLCAARPAVAQEGRSCARSRFERSMSAAGTVSAAAILDELRMAPATERAREPIRVVDFNGRPGDTFRLFYSLGVSEAPAAVPHLEAESCRASTWSGR